jgi:hypothetical protein
VVAYRSFASSSGAARKTASAARPGLASDPPCLAIPAGIKIGAIVLTSQNLSLSIVLTNFSRRSLLFFYVLAIERNLEERKMKRTLMLLTLVFYIGGFLQTANAETSYTPPVLGRDWACIVLNVSSSPITVTVTAKTTTGLTLSGLNTTWEIDPGKSGITAGSEVSDHQIYCKFSVNKVSKIRGLVSTIDSDNRLHEQAAK